MNRTTRLHHPTAWALGLSLAGIALPALAQEYGQVLSSTPVVQTVAVPRQVCTDQQVEVQQPKSGAGAALGAIAGGAAGNALGGRGAGRAAATMLGMVGGAIVGDRIESRPEPEWRTVRQCSTQTLYENRTVAYNVVYEYAGKQFSVQLPQDPGPTLALQINPVGTVVAPAQAPMPAPVTVISSTTMVPPPIFVPSPVVISAPPVYSTVVTRPFYPSINLDLGWNHWGGHHRHHGHERW